MGKHAYIILECSLNSRRIILGGTPHRKKLKLDGGGDTFQLRLYAGGGGQSTFQLGLSRQIFKLRRGHRTEF